MLYLSLRLVHIAAMAAWVGAVFFCSGDVRRTLAAQEASYDLLRDRMRRSLRVASGAGWLTVLSGLALIVVLGGFGSVPPAIHVGLLFGLAMIGVGGGLVGGSWRRIDEALAEGASQQTLAPLVKRLAIGNGVFHALWLAALALMVFRHG